MNSKYSKEEALSQKLTELMCMMEMYDLEETGNYWRDKLLELMENLGEKMRQNLPEYEDWDLNKED